MGHFDKEARDLFWSREGCGFTASVEDALETVCEVFEIPVKQEQQLERN